MSLRIAYRWQRISDWDEALCLRVNRFAARRSVVRLFRTVGRLGDGVFWYTLMAVLPVLFGAAALPAVLHMLLAGGVCTLLYKWLKARTSRPRPFRSNLAIIPGGPVLDEFSFPSGHTLHAVAFTLIALGYYPMLAWLLAPFALLVAASRVVLGLHYPSDVLVGAAIGALIAQLSFLLV